MLVTIALVGQGEKWHIARNKFSTYCGAKPDWVASVEKEMSEIDDLCANCKREKSREV